MYIFAKQRSLLPSNTLPGNITKPAGLLRMCTTMEETTQPHYLAFRAAKR